MAYQTKWKEAIYTYSNNLGCPIQLDEKEKILYRHINDLYAQAEERGVMRFSSFLDLRQQEIARYLQQPCSLFYGGFDNSERMIVGISYKKEICKNDFPITPVTVHFRKADKLSHRDFLGALMNLMIKRELLGDIIIGEGVGVIYAISSIAPMIISELNKIGKIGVKCEEGLPENFNYSPKFEDINGTVSSLRLDCIVSHMINTSREASTKIIASGKVSVNAKIIPEPSKNIIQGDAVSIRGFGKFILKEVGSLNKRGRIRIYCQKYI